jgi:hypothetical protein
MIALIFHSMLTAAGYTLIYLLGGGGLFWSLRHLHHRQKAW